MAYSGQLEVDLRLVPKKILQYQIPIDITKWRFYHYSILLNISDFIFTLNERIENSLCPSNGLKRAVGQ